MKVVDIGIKRSANLTQLIADVVNLGQVLSATIHLVIVEDMLIEVDPYHKRPSAITLTDNRQEYMFKGEMYIGLIPETNTSITEVNVVDC